MAEFGKFSEITFINGSSPPINADNLNEIERVIALADVELSRSQTVKFSDLIKYFYMRNIKYFYRFTDETVWTNSYSSYVDLIDERDDQLIGNNCLKMEIINASASWLSIYQTLSTPINLSVFNDESASSTDDLIVIVFYVSDINAFSTLQIRLGDDFSNCYLLDFTYSANTGWNTIYVQKTDFTTEGAPTGWNSIDYFRLAPYSVAGNVGEYILFNLITIIRQDAVFSGFCNAFQKYMGSVTGWINIFSILSDTCLLYYDYQDMIEQVGIMKIPSTDVEDELLLSESLIQFMSKFEFICKYAGETASITWEVDSNNYAEVYISSDTFYLSVVEGGGAPTVTSKALSTSLIKNEKVWIYFEKQNDTFRAILKKYGEVLITLEYETSISSSSDGNIYIGQSSTNSYSLLTDFTISNRPIGKLARELRPRFIRMQASQNLVNNSMTNLLGLVVNLEPLSYYKIDLYLIVSCTSATPNVEVSLELTDCYAYVQRVAQGPAYDMNDANNTKIRSSYYLAGTNIEYGVEGAGDETFIKETLIVLAEEKEGKVQIKASQANTDGSNPILVYGSSFMIITALEPGSHENL
jgi:hypothetical protein